MIQNVKNLSHPHRKVINIIKNKLLEIKLNVIEHNTNFIILGLFFLIDGVLGRKIKQTCELCKSFQKLRDLNVQTVNNFEYFI